MVALSLSSVSPYILRNRLKIFLFFFAAGHWKLCATLPLNSVDINTWLTPVRYIYSLFACIVSGDSSGKEESKHLSIYSPTMLYNLALITIFLHISSIKFMCIWEKENNRHIFTGISFKLYVAASHVSIIWLYALSIYILF